MTEQDIIAIGIVIGVILGVLVVYCLLSVNRFGARLDQYRDNVRLMTAEDNSFPVHPTIIEDWAAKKDRLPEGSPKWCAYRDNLEAAGYYTEEAIVARRSLANGD